MSKVYANSFCNIFATVARDSEHSLFNDRDLKTLVPVVLFTSIHGRPKSSVRIEDTSHWTRELINCHLNTRAWVLHERLLSPRNLCFGESQIFWDCYEQNASELYPNGFPRTTGFIGRDVHRADLNTRGKTGSQEDLRIWWRRALSSYTDCHLTNPSDKLPAISSIAQRLQTVLNDQYLVGLWRSQLPQDLFWQV